MVEAGNAESLLQAIEQASKQNADATSKRLFILVPNGVYDLGKRTLTAITGHRIALVGESMEGTVIVNAPDVEDEGISKTATLLNQGHETYVQDLTLKNALDYYHSGAAGRAVCWQDKGDRTMMKRVESGDGSLIRQRCPAHGEPPPAQPPRRGRPRRQGAQQPPSLSFQTPETGC